MGRATQPPLENLWRGQSNATQQVSRPVWRGTCCVVSGGLLSVPDGDGNFVGDRVHFLGGHDLPGHHLAAMAAPSEPKPFLDSAWPPLSAALIAKCVPRKPRTGNEATKLS